MSWRGQILEKINALPEPRRTKALQELEVHDYCVRHENKHNCLIADIPHPMMAVDEYGNWIV